MNINLKADEPKMNKPVVRMFLERNINNINELRSFKQANPDLNAWAKIKELNKAPESHFHKRLYFVAKAYQSREADKIAPSRSTKLIFDKKAVETRGYASLHKTNKNVVMNSSAMWYGPAKSGKTRMLINAFKGSNFIFLDMDYNYADVVSLVEQAGGIYINGEQAFDVACQLMDKDITDTVVIIDALNDVKTRLLRHYISNLNESIDKEEISSCEAAMSRIGISQEATTIWFERTIKKMINNSNSINFIHHTTENNGGSKVEGNAGAWAAKFDITYKIEKADNESYFHLTHQRSNIAPERVELSKTLKDQIEVILERLPEKIGSEYTGNELKIHQLKPANLPNWVNKDAVYSEIFDIVKIGNRTTYTLKEEYL